MGYTRIIALDLGKFKTVACVMDVATCTRLFETIPMSPGNVHDPVPSDAANQAKAFAWVNEAPTWQLRRMTIE